MKHKALLKLILCYVVVAIVMFVMLNNIGMRALRKHVVAERTEMLKEEALTISEEFVTSYYRDSTRLIDIMTQLRSMGRFLNTRIWIVNPNGLVFADTDTVRPAQGLNIDNLDPEFFNNLLENGALEEVYFNNVFTEKMMVSYSPIYSDYRLRGYVCVFSSMSGVLDTCNQYLDIVNICYLIFLLLQAIAFAFIYFMTLRPVRQMTKVTTEFAKGNFDEPMKIRSHDEFRELANAIEFMSDEFQNLGTYQKNFLANISHDFRSPLTSIKGYAEAMADGTIPPEMQKKYFDIILFETERLTKLTTNLLTINSIENNGMMLDKSVFDINEIIRKTALTFEGTCTRKRITLNLTFDEDVLPVEADKGKIQQVLYNLIDNAIKFSNADSSIDIRTELKSSKVFVAVKDYGIGIPKESLNRIWERFYKTDLSRGKDKKGTGLGLSIAKEIMTAHKENINVVSTEGVGTEFIFTLPTAYY